MEKSYSVQHARITLTMRCSIYEAIEQAFALAGELSGDTTVIFTFNGRTIMVRPDSNTDLILRDFWRPASITSETIGPYPDPTELGIDRALALERGSDFAAVL